MKGIKQHGSRKCFSKLRQIRYLGLAKRMKINELRTTRILFLSCQNYTDHSNISPVQ
ncbi:unnamed protein product [Larinioides sclopetarius]|uniref:Uncharacterized protein n=1 Tax=Larinioides sclopetarius TaxID=280406 RepID=A0AAV2BFX7_9ARAC